MDDDSRTFKLGLFVVGGFVVLFASILTIGAGAILKETQLPLYCYFGQSVDGLEVGAPVKYRGIKIGQVTAIDLRREDSADAAFIRVVCDIDPVKLNPEADDFFLSEEEFRAELAKRVARGLRIQLAWGGLTSTNFLELDYMQGPEYAAPKLPFEAEDPHVPTYTPPSLTDIQRGVNDAITAIMEVDFAGISDRLVKSLDTLEQRVGAINSPEISASASRALDSADALFRNQELLDSLDNLKAVTENLNKTTTHLDELIAKKQLDRTLEDFAASGESLRKTMAVFEEKLPAVLDGVNGVLDTARKAIAEAQLGETSAAIQGAADEVGRTARDLSAVRDDFTRTMRDLSSASRSVARVARRLDEGGSGLLKLGGEEN